MVRSQILLMNALPSVRKAYSVVNQDESQKTLAGLNANADVTTQLYAQNDYQFTKGKGNSKSKYSTNQVQSQDTVAETTDAKSPNIPAGPVFTSEQYNQILELLGNENVPSTNHSVANLIGLPNGTKTHIAHVGSAILDNGMHLSKDLYSGKLKGIGKHKQGLYFLDPISQKSIMSVDASHKAVRNISKEQSNISSSHANAAARDELSNISSSHANAAARDELVATSSSSHANAIARDKLVATSSSSHANVTARGELVATSSSSHASSARDELVASSSSSHANVAAHGELVATSSSSHANTEARGRYTTHSSILIKNPQL
ncbi:uncharacterized protein LOC116112546 [Pistacia vera]|uniref:uncharacterized protein LOC116112546 n=1 Tax=Pistacia vera TaxID=55513 RepID=UPI001263728E|nr:uncharacterized protein LOC116112546 [Pistacia vera]